MTITTNEHQTLGAVERLLTEVEDDRVAHDHAARTRLQLEAANDRLATQRQRIPLLDRRAKDAGVEQIESPADLVGLLFAHTTYKTYPESFLAKQRWDRMSMWLDTVTADSPSTVPLDGVGDVDDWIGRLREAGIHLIVSSGTTGKHSFLPLNDTDIEFLANRTFVTTETRLPYTYLGPSNAPMRPAYAFRATAARFGREGAIHSLEEPMLVADMIRAGEIRRRMADGTALPSEVAAFEAEVADKAKRRNAQFEALIDKILEYRDEPQIVTGGWATFWLMMTRARERGLGDGIFHPDTIASIAGGRKGLDLPDDYEEQMSRFLGPVKRPTGYGMSELSIPARMCEQGVYHWPPTMLLMILDETGEELLEPDADGTVEGRLAAYDPAWTSIWGGIISGDRVTASYAPCACGRPGPTIAPDIVRYSELSAGGDDKLTCGGTIAEYIRGFVGG